MHTTELWVERGNLRNTRIMERQLAPLGDGEVLVRIDKFGLTANNVSYAVSGDMIGYWKYYPAEGEWGKVPVWAFGDVIESRSAEIPVGERIWGFFPMATHVVLQPGEALFLGAGNVHAYLSGTGLEVMASSDNVVRAAFTRKHVDVDEFLAIAALSASAPPVIHADHGPNGRSTFSLPIPHFGLERIDVDGRTTVGPARGTEMLVCTDGDAGVLARGQAGILRDGDAAELRGVATVFRAWGRH
jgi:mannose-6-phosphate isomerase class I